MAITRTLRNSGANRTGETQTVISVTCNAGSTLLVSIASDGTAISSVTWNGLTLTQVAQVGTTALTSLYALYNNPFTAINTNVVINWSGTCSSKAIVVTEVTEIGPTPLTSSATGTGTAPSSGATATTSVANTFVWGVICTDGPNGDVAGTWQNSFTPDTRIGSTGGQATTNSTIDTAYRIVSATGSFTAAKTGITSRDWGALVAAFAATVTAPTFDIGTGTYSSNQTVTISTTTSGASIYYTLDGSTPTASSTLYTGPVTVSQTAQLKAIAILSGYQNSSVTSATYTMVVPVPSISPTTGTFNNDQTITITDSLSGVTIYYTTNNTAPTTGSTLYSGSFTLSSSGTVRAIAVKSGWTNSSEATASTITLQCTAPSFSPAGGSYSSTQSVTLSSTTSGASIYYTQDGSTPTTSSTLYTGAISVSTTKTIQAITAKSGYTTSSVSSATYNFGISINWSVTGNVTSNSATVILRASSSANLSLKVYENAGGTLITTTSSLATSLFGTYNVVKIPISGLQPGIKYKYVPNDGTTDITAATGYFTTFPSGAASYKFIHYSCNNTVNNVLFSTISAKNPLFMACIGDFHYTDTNTTVESDYYPFIDAGYSASNAKTCYTNFAYDRIWDDHDFCGNNSNSASAGKQYSAAAFRKFTAHYTLPDPNGFAVYHSFVCGRIRFVFMDVRSEKTASQVLSTTQMSWVKNELLSAKQAGQVVCLASGNPWIGDGLSGDSDAWGGTGGPAQRTELATYIRQIQMNRSIFLISGDSHMLAWDDGTNNTYGVGGGANFRVFQGAAFSQTGSVKGGPYSGGTRANTAAGDTNGQYAEVDVSDTGGKRITVTWTGRFSSSDTVWQSVVFDLEVPKKAKSRVIFV